jgi:hypothetical protein
MRKRMIDDARETMRGLHDAGNYWGKRRGILALLAYLGQKRGCRRTTGRGS